MNFSKIKKLFFPLIAAVMLSAILPSCVEEYESNILSSETWNDPPPESRPYTRWWWPGGAVEENMVRSEIQRCRDLGLGGIEIQPFRIGLSENEASTNPNIRTVGESVFFDLIEKASDEAASCGLGFDVTLGSGWPSGSPSTGDSTEKQLLMAHIDITGPQQFSGELPDAEPPDYIPIVEFAYDTLGSFDENMILIKVVGAKVIDDSQEPIELDNFIDLSNLYNGSILDWSVPEGNWRVFAFYENTTSHKVFGAAYPGEDIDSLVVDHLDYSGIETIINGYGTDLINSVPSGLIDSIFIDSFEPIGELPWTTDFLEQFETQKGYDLTPYIPLVFIKGGEAKVADLQDELRSRNDGPLYSAKDIGDRVREDYEDVRASLFTDEFVKPVIDWAHENDLTFRLQAHGGYDDYIDVYELADIPETEGLFGGGGYDFLKLASSAGHTGGKKIISSESFINLTFTRTSLTMTEMRLLAGRSLSAGINRLIHHGMPYEYQREDGSQWYPFCGLWGGLDLLLSGILPMTNWIKSDKNQQRLSSFNDYIGRLSYAMSVGNHVSEIAWLKPDRFYKDIAPVVLLTIVPNQYESDVTSQLKKNGYIYDRISPRGLINAQITMEGFSVGEAGFKALLISDLSVAEPELLDSAVKIAESGVPVVVLGDLPKHAPGFFNADYRDGLTEKAVMQLSKSANFINHPKEIAHILLNKNISPPISPVNDEPMKFAIDHRVFNDGHIFLVFNESYIIKSQRFKVNVPGLKVGRWDAHDGTASTLVKDLTMDSVFQITLSPAESAVITVE